MLKGVLIAMALTVAATGANAQINTNPAEKLVMETSKGKVVIALRPDLAPGHVARVKELAKKGFYDGVIFHRVIKDFMAQTGDPTGTGTGGSELPDLKQEFTDTPYVRGTVGAARTSDPNSANSQFFITFGDASFLNGQYTVWGQVVEGMDVVDAINKGEPPANPDKIVKMTVEEAAAPAAK
jgi:cyclophilin family peptidyl-prolyl cis-trans isomerase